MSTWLLTWNPNKSGGPIYPDEVEEIEEFGFVAGSWSCGNTQRIGPGERFFLHRQAVEPRGLISSGYTDSSPYLDQHWSGRGTALYVDTIHDFLSEEPIIPLDELQQDPLLSASVWRTQASGVEIPSQIAVEIERRWEERTGLAGARPPAQEIVEDSTLPEGAQRRVIVNAYERNPVARRRCLEHHGYACAVCGVVLQDVYGPIAKSFIEVHHKKPLSKIGRKYRIDPVRDLVPICPNCHAIVHRADPPLSIRQARRRLRF